MYGKRNNTKAEELLYELIDSKTVLPCYNSNDPRVSLTDTKDFDSYKLYLSDIGLFVTLMFIDRPVAENGIYAKLLSDKLPANLGYLYENLVAQMITYLPLFNQKKSKLMQTKGQLMKSLNTAFLFAPPSILSLTIYQTHFIKNGKR